MSIELQDIFEVLRASSIDEEILRVNMEYDDSQRKAAAAAAAGGTTLFDYIDDQAVFEIQKLADDAICEIEASFSLSL